MSCSTKLYITQILCMLDFDPLPTKYCHRWLRHCATNRKVTGSIPYVIGIFHWHSPSGRTVALGLTQPLTEMSTRNISWEWRLSVLRADNLTTFMCQLSWNLGASTSWNPQGLPRPVMGLLYLYLLPTKYVCVCEYTHTHTHTHNCIY